MDVTLTGLRRTYRTLVLVLIGSLAQFVLCFNVKAQTTETASQCINIEHQPMFSLLVNSCDKKLWVKWFDQGNCKTGCGDTVAAHGRETISKVTGYVSWAACVYPAAPSREWQGTGRYYCTD